MTFFFTNCQTSTVQEESGMIVDLNKYHRDTVVLDRIKLSDGDCQYFILTLHTKDERKITFITRILEASIGDTLFLKNETLVPIK